MDETKESGRWRYDGQFCFRCMAHIDEQDPPYSVAIDKEDGEKMGMHRSVYLKMDVPLCKECHREWMLGKIGI